METVYVLTETFLTAVSDKYRNNQDMILGVYKDKDLADKTCLELNINYGKDYSDKIGTVVRRVFSVVATEFYTEKKD